MSLYDLFESDPTAERDGIVLEYGANKDGTPIEIRIRRAGGENHQFQKTFEAKTKPYRRIMDRLDKKTNDRIMREIYAESIIVGWSGVQDRDGNTMEFNRENAIKLLTDLPNVFNDIMRQSQNEDLFRKNLREEESGN